MFEARSLVIITAITLLVTSLAISLSWFVNRRIRGANYWSLGYFLLAGGVALQATQGYLPSILSIALANILLTGGIYYTLLGVSLFHGRRPPDTYMLPLLVGGVVVVHIVAGLGPEGFAQRSMMISGIIGMIALLISYSFLAAESGNNRMVYRINAAIYLLLAIAFIARTISSVLIPPQVSVVENTAFNHYTYFGATVFNVLIAFSYMLTLFDSQGMRVQHAADTDFRTGLLNREAISRQADQLIKRVQAFGGQASVILFRLSIPSTDKRAADASVYRFAEKLYRSFRPQDLVARIGEREFAVVVEHGGDRTHLKTAKQIKQMFALDEPGDNYVAQQCSVDHIVVEVRPGDILFDLLLERAEKMWSAVEASPAVSGPVN